MPTIQFPRPLVVAALLGVAQLQSAGAEPALVVSVCELVADPTRFVGHEVRVRARYFVNPYHASSLRDDRCRGAGINMTWNASTPHRSIANLDRAIGKSLNEDAVALFDVEVVGKFSWDATGTIAPDAIGSRPSRGTLDVSRVWMFARWKL